VNRGVTTLFAAWLLGGCSSPGLLYTNVTLPLTLDMGATPRATDSAVTVQRSVREPFAGLRAEWAGTESRERARIGGMDTVSYADVHRHSVVGGLWGSTTLVVHGQRELKSASVPRAGEAGAQESVRTRLEMARDGGDGSETGRPSKLPGMTYGKE
jgi:hypothetical protein